MTIEPPPASFMAGMTLFMPMKTPVRLMSRTLRKCSTDSDSRNWPVDIPALLTSPWTPPNSVTAKLHDALPVLLGRHVVVREARALAELGGGGLALLVEHVGQDDVRTGGDRLACRPRRRGRGRRR